MLKNFPGSAAAKTITISASVIAPLIVYFVSTIIIEDHSQIRTNTSRLDKIETSLDKEQKSDQEFRSDVRTKLGYLEAEASRSREIDAQRSEVPERLNRIEQMLQDHHEETLRAASQKRR